MVRKAIVAMMGCAVALTHSASVWAFHTGPTLVCSECHTMHFSQNGGTPSGGVGTAKSFLMLKSNSTDLCLSCHDGTGNYGTKVGSEYAPNVYDPTNDFPGGHFKDVATDDAKGHNPGGTLIGTDATLTTAPGGTYSSSNLRCASCHDVHGNNNFRILKDNAGGGGNPAPVEGTDGFETVIANNSWTGETATKHNGYKRKFSDWCANCHDNFHGGANQNTASPYKRHPTSDSSAANQGKLNTAIVVSYGLSYDPTVPFEDADVNAANVNSRVSANDKVFCLTCHRAHGSANKDAGRWDFSVASGSGAKCNKCHAK